MTTILGIETSCDDTGVAIYNSDKGLMAHSLYSQIDLHTLYGGVVPELASRDHLEKIIPLIKDCCNKAQIQLAHIDAISYTCGPGLNGALLIGAGVANGLGYSLKKPIIPIHHLEGHLLSPFLTNANIQFPFLALLVSGGHSQIIIAKEIGKYEIIGDTLDDAAGEAFDKTAKMLGLPYPGGYHIAKLAQTGHPIYDLPRPMLNSKDLNMSFSGLKTAVLTLIEKLKNDQEELSNTQKSNLASSIEEAITDVLAFKIDKAIQLTGINNLIIAGGVSANVKLKNKILKLKATNPNLQVTYPPLQFCTDNGAMIAIAGFYRFKEAKYDYSFSVKPRFDLSSL